MKCDDFLPRYAAGGMVGRLFATIHAARCANCSLVRKHFLEAQRDWADPPEVTAEHQAAWLRAADSEPRVASAKISATAKWAMASSALLVTAAAVAVFMRLPHEARAPRSDHDGDSPKLQAVAEFPRELAALTQIGRGLSQIAADLRDLEKQTALMDARRDVDRLATRYKPLGLPQQSPATAN